ncbi:hypothetical protein AKJ65_03545 [candidate division MSBL1 archaeon SCGC-AAA259E19]|uniref:PIN domain-containing protein n=1 Tax=candidate division MSBL1 archaeon SCGC-AAA259E19 TaxID=1698264 RepID=A0A133UKN2_9EURY|nr:hypothetical protein AKJ65_03545 [candidate division MSBL1 archaeon SCGC-AAA259E19]
MRSDAMLDFDMPYAFLNKDSRWHETAKRIFSRIKSEELDFAFSTIGFVELEVVYRSLGLSDSDVVEDSSTLLAMDIEIIPLPAEAIITAGQVREEHDLSFWDSHYAAHALLENGKLVSSDDSFDRVEGVERIDPADLT